MGRAWLIVIGLIGAALIAPASAAARATAEERAFAAAFSRFDVAVRAATRSPATIGAMRARQRAAADCLESARALARSGDGVDIRPFEAVLFYTAVVTEPLVTALAPTEARYRHDLIGMRLRDPDLRSARAILVPLLYHDATSVLGSPLPTDFCTPLRAWQGWSFAEGAEPEMLNGVIAALDASPSLTGRHRAKLRRATPHLRAAGVPAAARERFVYNEETDFSGLFRRDPIFAALLS